MRVLGPLLTLLAIVPMASAAVTAVVCMMVAAQPLKLYSPDGESDGHSHRRDILAHKELSAHQARHWFAMNDEVWGQGYPKIEREPWLPSNF